MTTTEAPRKGAPPKGSKRPECFARPGRSRILRIAKAFFHRKRNRCACGRLMV